MRVDSSWESWDFEKLCEALRLWCRRNPIEQETSWKSDRKKGGKFYGAQQKNVCVYCNVSGHKSVNCPKVVCPEERKKVLKEKRLCFNWTGSHFASNCTSKVSCEFCHLKHHSSIHSPPAEKSGNESASRRSEKLMAAHSGGENTVVIVDVDGIKTRALVKLAQS